MKGYSLIEVLIAIGISSIVVLVISTFFQNSGDATKSVEKASDLSTIRFLFVRQTDCKLTLMPDEIVASQCQNTSDPKTITSCDEVPGADKFIDIFRQGKADAVKILTGSGQTFGQFDVRACCPGGKLRIEARAMNKARTDEALDPLTKKKKGWQSVVRSVPLCGAYVPPAKKKVIVVRGNLRRAPPVVLCPGRFGNVPSLNTPENYLFYYDGQIQCPVGHTLVGGGADCRNLGFLPLFIKRSGSIEGHPLASASPDGKMGKSNQYHASCCAATTSPTLINRMYALCQKN